MISKAVVFKSPLGALLEPLGIPYQSDRPGRIESENFGRRFQTVPLPELMLT